MFNLEKKLKKAFDTVDHQILLRKLELYMKKKTRKQNHVLLLTTQI